MINVALLGINPNDLPNSSLKLSFYLFADDTNIYFESDSPGNLEKVVNKQVRQFKKWLDANTLAISVEKTYFVILHSAQSSLKASVNIKIGNQLVQQAEHVTFMGLHLDDCLNWKQGCKFWGCGECDTPNRKNRTICSLEGKEGQLLPLPSSMGAGRARIAL